MAWFKKRISIEQYWDFFDKVLKINGMEINIIRLFTRVEEMEKQNKMLVEYLGIEKFKEAKEGFRKKK